MWEEFNYKLSILLYLCIVNVIEIKAPKNINIEKNRLAEAT
jgi:hypothetical protein